MSRSPLHVAATTTSNPRSDEPAGLCLTLDDARAVLEHWRNSHECLGFSFFRAAEGWVQTGHASVHCVDARSLVLDAGDRRFAVPIEDAWIEFTQASLCRPGFRTTEVEGLSVSFANDDWLFVFQETTTRPRSECAMRRVG